VVVVVMVVTAAEPGPSVAPPLLGAKGAGGEGGEDGEDGEEEAAVSVSLLSTTLTFRSSSILKSFSNSEQSSNPIAMLTHFGPDSGLLWDWRAQGVCTHFGTTAHASLLASSREGLSPKPVPGPWGDLSLVSVIPMPEAIRRPTKRAMETELGYKFV
jgi:hypothetical protein